MFTGIVEEIGRIEAIEALEGGRRVRVGCSFAGDLRVDESVAVDGACLTVVAQDARGFEAVAVEETLRKTTLGEREPGDGVNLERAMLLGSRLDGHLVQGHVDARGEVVEIVPLADSHEVVVRYPEAFAPYLIPKGSVTVDGVSLTVAALDEPEGTLRLAIIPHTWSKTTAGLWREGQAVNLEFDLVGKYVVRGQGRAANTSHG